MDLLLIEACKDLWRDTPKRLAENESGASWRHCPRPEQTESGAFRDSPFIMAPSNWFNALLACAGEEYSTMQTPVDRPARSYSVR
jgi:hypothetical protein